LLVLLLLALLLLALLFDLELDALFFDPLELPDLVGMALSFPAAQTVQPPHGFLCRFGDTCNVPLLFSMNK
jgi:hypothetical protein